MTVPAFARFWECGYENGGIEGVLTSDDVLTLLLGYYLGECINRGENDGDMLCAFVAGWLGQRARFTSPMRKRAYEAGRRARRKANGC